MNQVQQSYAGQVPVDLARFQSEALSRFASAYRLFLSVTVNADGSGRLVEQNGREMSVPAPRSATELVANFLRLNTFLDEGPGYVTLLRARHPFGFRPDHLLVAAVACSLDGGTRVVSPSEALAFAQRNGAKLSDPEFAARVARDTERDMPPEALCTPEPDAPVVDFTPYAQLPSDIAYVHLEGLTKGLAAQLEQQLPRGGAAMRGLILDLRNNQGGELDGVLAIADLFLGEGAALNVVSRDRSTSQAFDTKSASSDIDVPIVVLINRGTTHGGEMLAAILQHRRRATLVGEKTAGRGAVQTLFRVAGLGSFVKLTTAQVHTPDGPLTGQGVPPDVRLDSRDVNGAAAVRAAVERLARFGNRRHARL